MKSPILLPRAEVDLFDAAVWYEGEREGLGRAFEDGGPSGLVATLVVVWIVRSTEEFPRFVTAYPGEER
jgi:hypothetical protein